MKLFVVSDFDRWGHSLNVVRASTVEEAVRLAVGKRPPDMTKGEAEEISPDGAPGVLWCHDVSPDTNDPDW